MINIKLPNYKYVGASIGSGKTYQAINMICENNCQNYLYVAPTIKLLEQVEQSFKEMDEHKSKRVFRVDGSNTTGAVRDVALAQINITEANTSTVVLMTTTTFLAIVADIQWKHHWNVVFDEAFNPIEPFIADSDYLDVFIDYLDFSDTEYVIAKSEDELKKFLITDNVISDDVKEVFNQVISGVYSVELASPKKITDDVKRLSIVSYMNPECLKDFREVLFLAALFESTVLYHLWKNQGVEYSEHPYFDNKLRNIHCTKGKLVNIGYILEDGDTTSTTTFTKSMNTGRPLGKSVEGGSVIHELIRQADSYLKKDYLIAYNKWVKVNPAVQHADAIKVPAMAQGLNEYQHINNMACLLSTNPAGDTANWIATRTGLDVRKVNQIYRTQTIYQSLGRCSIRDVDNNNPKVWLIASKEDAEFIYELFDDATWLGKVGDMSKIPKYSENSFKNTDSYKEIMKEKRQAQKNIGKAKTRGNADLEEKWEGAVIFLNERITALKKATTH